MKRIRSSSPSNGPRKGGVRQRMRQTEKREGPGNDSSTLLALLLQLFAWGDISAQLVQSISAAAYKDACDLKENRSSLGELERISTIGYSGLYPNKCYSELMQRIPYAIKIPKPFTLSLPFKKPYKQLDQGFLLPHELFASIFEWYPKTWTKSVVPSQASLRNFWKTNINHPTMRTHDLKDRENFQEWAVPISLHGDDVPITGVGKAWVSQMTTFSICSMVARGETKDVSFFVYGCFERLRVVDPDQSKDTLGCFFKLLVWSFHWLYRGCWPDRDCFGKVQLGYLHFITFSIQQNRSICGLRTTNNIEAMCGSSLSKKQYNKSCYTETLFHSKRTFSNQRKKRTR